MTPVLKSLITRGAGAIPMSLLGRFRRPVLNYHACFDSVPAGVAAVDNIRPRFLYDHLNDLKRSFTFLPIDEFVETRSRAPIAALTFDDGYRSVLETALPICAGLDIPLTVFLNTSAFERKAFWRHKVVLVMENGWVEECERSFRRVVKVPGLGFYAYLKHPINSSVTVEAELDAFLESKGCSGFAGREAQEAGYIADDGSCLPRHPLISYGNHSHNHYVLSSLTQAQQHSEIARCKDVLETLQGVAISSVFSPPFGQPMHVNRETAAIVKELGYKAILLNRGYLNGPLLGTFGGIPVVERFSPVESPILDQIARESVRTLKPAALRGTFAKTQPKTRQALALHPAEDTLDR